MVDKPKKNYLWIGIAFIVLTLAFVLNTNDSQKDITGNIVKESTESSQYAQQEITCNSPYIKVGTSCCLDQNSNNICDKDEQIISEENQSEIITNLCDYSEIKRIQSLSIKELVHDVVKFTTENGEQKEVQFGGYGIPDGDSKGYSYEFDFASGKEYYFISASDYEKNNLIDSIKFYYARGTSDLINKNREGSITSRMINLIPGRDSNIIESEHFWDSGVDGLLEMYQSFDCYGYSNCNYDEGIINENLVDERPNAITNVEINNDFRRTVTRVVMYINNCI